MCSVCVFAVCVYVFAAKTMCVCLSLTDLFLISFSDITNAWTLAGSVCVCVCAMIVCVDVGVFAVCVWCVHLEVFIYCISVMYCNIYLSRNNPVEIQSLFFKGVLVKSAA